MRISGTHTINRGLQRVAAELLEPDMIGSLVGSTIQITSIENGKVDFVVRREASFFTVNLRGVATIRPTARRNHFDLTLEARHRAAGGIKVALSLVLMRPAQGQTEIRYDGEAEASGLVEGILIGRIQLLETMIARAFERFDEALNRKIRAEYDARKAAEAALNAAPSASAGCSRVRRSAPAAACGPGCDPPPSRRS